MTYRLPPTVKSLLVATVPVALVIVIAVVPSSALRFVALTVAAVIIPAAPAVNPLAVMVVAEPTTMLVAVAEPRTGVTSVGVFANTREPVPV